MKKIGIIASVLGALGVGFGAFGAHSIKGHVSDQHYAAYRVGIEYLFFHLVPLFYISTQLFSKQLNQIAWIFILGIIFFAGSNILMTTEEIHHINFRFLWPITPLGGVLMMIGWVRLAISFYTNKD